MWEPRKNKECSASNRKIGGVKYRNRQIQYPWTLKSTVTSLTAKREQIWFKGKDELLTGLVFPDGNIYDFKTT